MPIFFTKSGSFQDLIVTGSRLYVASSSIFFNNLSTTSQTNVLTIDTSTGQLYYTASSALSTAPPSETLQQIINNSIVSNEIIGTIGSSDALIIKELDGENGLYIYGGSTSPNKSVWIGAYGSLNNAPSPAIGYESGDLIIRGLQESTTPRSILAYHSGVISHISASSITFPYTGNAVITGSLLVSGSSGGFGGITGSLQGTASYAITASYAMNGGGSGTTFYIATGSVTASVNVNSTSFQVTSGSSTFMSISSSGQIAIGPNPPSYSLDVNSTNGSARFKGAVYLDNYSGGGSGLYFIRPIDGALQTALTVPDYGTLKIGGGNQNNIDIHGHTEFLARFQNGASAGTQYTFTSTGPANISGSSNSYSASYMLNITGSGKSGSFNANNILFVSGSTVTISGSLTVVSGSTEFQVLGTGVKMGNTGSDAHTMTGSFGVQVAPVGGNIPGGITVTNNLNNVDYATNFTIGNYTIVAQRTPAELYFSASSTATAGPYLIGTQMYFGQTSPRLIFGGGTGPNNVSYMSIGPNTGSEYINNTTYPSGSNNFFLINTNLSAASPSTVQRRSLYIGAQDIRFFISGSTNGDSFSSATPVMTIGSGSNVTITGSTNVLTVRGSGSLNPLFSVVGSQGELFSITDSLSGSLFSVNDISGLPILDVNSDQTTKIGSYLAPGMYTSTRVTANTGITVIYSIPTASYDSAYFDYNIRSGSVGRAGQIMAMWSGSSVNYSEVSASSFGTTNTFVFGVSISGSNMILSGSAPSNGWTVKTIVKAI